MVVMGGGIYLIIRLQQLNVITNSYSYEFSMFQTAGGLDFDFRHPAHVTLQGKSAAQIIIKKNEKKNTTLTCSRTKKTHSRKSVHQF